MDLLVPKMPIEILDAINNKNLAIFIGAGVSRLVDCDGWNQLANNLIERCFHTKTTTGDTLINEEEKQVLLKSLHEKKEKKVISICYEILNKFDDDLFFEELGQSLKKDEKIKSPNIYSEVYKLLNPSIDDISGIYITTNADEHFDTHFTNDPGKIVFDPVKFDISKVGNVKLYHIHGSISHRETLVFTVDQYFKRYTDENFINVLKTIFAKYIILFIGYGLDEFEIIDFLFTKLGSEHKGKDKIERKDFLLRGYEKDEKYEFEFDKLYYKKLGITVLRYEMDRDYSQLYNVLSEWNEEISDRESRIYDSYQKMLEVIKEHELRK